EGRALSVAGAASVLVLLEQVERATLAVDDDAAQPRARDADLARTGATAGARRGSRAVRACGIRRAACGAAAAGGDQDGRQGRCEGDEDCDLALHGSSFQWELSDRRRVGGPPVRRPRDPFRFLY